MGLITNIRFGLRFKNLYLILEAIKKIKNWEDYFLDFCSLTKKDYIIYHMKNGMKYFVRAKTTDRGIVSTVHLGDEYKIDQLNLSKDSVIIDIGAQIGVFSTYISHKVGKIFAYEPEIENYNLLLKNIEINNLKGKIRAVNCGVSDKKEKLKIYISKNNTGGHSIYGKGNNYIVVPAITLKDIFDRNNIDKCDLLKMDVEGSEYKILYGLPKNYFRKIKRIRLEYHDIDKERENHNFLMDFLEKKGYDVVCRKGYLFAKR